MRYEYQEFEVVVQSDNYREERLAWLNGLGVVQRLLLDNPQVKNLLTVEKVWRVKEACMEHFKRLHGQIAIYDFYSFHSRLSEMVNHIDQYDTIIGDIWPEISSKCLPEYKKFKAHANKLLAPGGKILGWGSEYYEHLIIQEQQ